MELSLRAMYDAVEQRVTPVVEELVGSDQFKTATLLAAGVQRTVAKRAQGAFASVLHFANLPAGTDVKKLRRQVGDLDFEVRALRMDLAAQRDHDRRGDDGGDR